MSNKLYTLICTLTTAVAGAAIGIVTYLNPSTAEAINASISIAEGAIIAIVGNFVINKQNKLKK